MKRVLCLVLVCCIMCSACIMQGVTVFADEEITIIVDGNKIVSDTPPVIVEGRTLVPLRVLMEAFNATVQWNAEQKTAICKFGEDSIIVKVDSNIMYKNYDSISLDVPAKLINDRTMVPIRAIAEATEATVDWNMNTNSVIIKSSIKNIDEVSTNNEANDNKNSDTIKNDSDDGELKCSVSVQNSNLMVGNKYRIVFALNARGKGGEGDYKYKFELYQNGAITEQTAYSEQNKYEKTITGTGSCYIIVYVKDKTGAEATSTYTFVE